MAEGRDIPIVEQGKKPGKRPPWWKRLWGWTEFGKKTGWEWLELLIVPLALAVIGFWFTVQQDARQQRFENQRAEQAQKIENQRAEAERTIQQQNAQDQALQAYLDQMSILLLEKDLRNSEEDSEVRTLARARTLTVLGRMDPSRKTAVMDFLMEADLVQGVEGRQPIIRLSEANLRDADLFRADLSGADLSEADLRGTNLDHANLHEADLSGAYARRAILRSTDLIRANLSSADLAVATLDFANLREAYVEEGHGVILSEATLEEADLSGVNLRYANLEGADLVEADLSEADLSEALLGGASLSGADLSGADLEGANITKEQLDLADSLVGATMPDGSKHP